MEEESPKWIDDVSNMFSILVQHFFNSHTSIRCISPDSPSGHDYIRDSMTLFTKDGNVVIHSICRYCGNQKRQVIDNVTLNPSFSNSNNFSERAM